MKKSAIFLSTAVVALFASVSLGQESVIWMDARPNNTAAGVNTITGGSIGNAFNNPYIQTGINSGRRGAGQVVRLEGKRNLNRHLTLISGGAGLTFPNHDGDSDPSTASIWVYLDMNDDPDGTGDVLASLGLNINNTPLVPGDLRNRINSISFQLFNDGNVRNSITGGQPLVWDDKVDGAVVPGDPPSWAGAKAVRVPVSAGPVYNASLGITPRPSGLTDIPYRVGRLDLVAGSRNCVSGGLIGGLPAHAAKSTYNVHMSVNNLLIARVFETGGDTPPDEKISFGYNGSIPELPVVSGSQQGATSTLPDAIVEIRMKGDYNGDGQVSSADNSAHSAAVSAASDTLLQVYTGDFNNSNTVTSADTSFFAAARAVGSLAPIHCP